MVEVEAVINNSAGIHCRPSAEIIKETAKFESTMTVIAPEGESVIASTLELLMLGMDQGTQIRIQADGPDEEVAIVRFKELFEKIFDFPDAGEGF